jgi:hypothetical protein
MTCPFARPEFDQRPSLEGDDEHERCRCACAIRFRYPAKCLLILPTWVWQAFRMAVPVSQVSRSAARGFVNPCNLRRLVGMIRNEVCSALHGARTRADPVGDYNRLAFGGLSRIRTNRPIAEEDSTGFLGGALLTHLENRIANALGQPGLTRQYLLLRNRNLV